MTDKNQTFTPGPWTYGDDENGDCFVFIPDGHNLCFGDMETTDGCCWANARLIAAAPDLLEALKNLSEACWAADIEGDLSSLVSGSLLNAADAAIAKAEGKDENT